MEGEPCGFETFPGGNSPLEPPEFCDNDYPCRVHGGWCEPEDLQRKIGLENREWDDN